MTGSADEIAARTETPLSDWFSEESDFYGSATVDAESIRYVRIGIADDPSGLVAHAGLTCKTFMPMVFGALVHEDDPSGVVAKAGIACPDLMKMIASLGGCKFAGDLGDFNPGLKGWTTHSLCGTTCAPSSACELADDLGALNAALRGWTARTLCPSTCQTADDPLGVGAKAGLACPDLMKMIGGCQFAGDLGDFNPGLKGWTTHTLCSTTCTRTAIFVTSVGVTFSGVDIPLFTKPLDALLRLDMNTSLGVPPWLTVYANRNGRFGQIPDVSKTPIVYTAGNDQFDVTKTMWFAINKVGAASKNGPIWKNGSDITFYFGEHPVMCSALALNCSNPILLDACPVTCGTSVLPSIRHASLQVSYLSTEGQYTDSSKGRACLTWSSAAGYFTHDYPDLLNNCRFTRFDYPTCYTGPGTFDRCSLPGVHWAHIQDDTDELGTIVVDSKQVLFVQGGSALPRFNAKIRIGGDDSSVVMRYVAVRFRTQDKMYFQKSRFDAARFPLVSGDFIDDSTNQGAAIYGPGPPEWLSRVNRP
jgi:hypothetical protein